MFQNVSYIKTQLLLHNNINDRQQNVSIQNKIIKIRLSIITVSVNIRTEYSLFFLMNCSLQYMYLIVN